VPSLLSAEPIDSGSTAWLFAAAALVLMMTPGVVFFYGGMVRRKNVLGVVMQGFVAMAVVSVLWVVVGFSLAFAGTGRFIGDLRYAGLPAHLDNPLTPGVPLLAFAFFQMMFAVVTPVLITGAGVERWRFGAFAVFVGIWSLAVYAPVAHWVFDRRGWAAEWGVLDFAGGTVVHINAGAAALAVAIVLGRRRGWPDQGDRPHNLPLVMLGLALLWFGWLGFNGGSAYGADELAATALINTQVGAAAGVLGWIGAERLRYGKPTTLGAASGAVSGLVAITPAAGYVSPLAGIGIGLLAGVLCHLAVGLKRWFNVDDSLDVAAVHLGGALVGCLCVGLFASRSVNPAGANGLFFAGGYRLLGVQAGTAGVVVAYSFVATLIIASVMNRFVAMRVPNRQETVGLDLALHGENAYDLVPAERAAVPVTAEMITGPTSQPRHGLPEPAAEWYDAQVTSEGRSR
jgi:ammonium transporter, Amt family